MGWKHIAIQESLKFNDISITDRLTRSLLGVDTPRDDHGHWFKEEGAKCPHEGGSGGEKESAESLRQQISKLSRFGEAGKKRAELQKKLNELEKKPDKSVKPHTERPKYEKFSAEEFQSFPVTEHKKKQFDIIQKTNPMLDDYHTGIRKPENIRSPEEAFSQNDGEGYLYPDFTKKDGENALKTGMVTVYSSYPIKNGVFVSPSRSMASDYSGNGKVYSLKVPLESVAWINSDEGQFADTSSFSNDGGPGSGNFGHSGRPGKVGGSAKGSGGSAFRSGSKETGYSSFAKHEQFKGIVSHARNSEDYHSFVRSMSEDQKNALRAQRRDCGTSESMQRYAERIFSMLKNRSGEKEIRQKNKPVDGKDISVDWYKRHSDPPRTPTREIDTDIEEVLHIQGFDGVPKVVSQEEFKKIVKEHPEMPILLRSFAGKDEATLKQYDKDLESGWFYVDCSEGGAGFGQGMYSAGVYEHGIADYDVLKDPNLKKAPGHIKCRDGEIYKVSGRQWETNNYVVRDPDEGDKYLFTKENSDGTFERRMLEAVDLDEFGMIWRDMNTGELIDEGMWLGPYDYFQDIEAVTENAAMEDALEGAKTEMRHYRKFNVNKIQNNIIPDPPEGKIRASFFDAEDVYHHYYFDKKDFTPFRKEPGAPVTNKPEAGRLVVIGRPDNKYLSNFTEAGESVWLAKDNMLLSPNGRISLTYDDLDEGDQWAYLEGRCEQPEINPVASTRMMTLDPSAKIITHEDLLGIRNKADRIRDDGKREREAKEKEFFGKIETTDDLERAFMERALYDAMRGSPRMSNFTPETINKIAKYRDSHPERMKEIQGLVEWAKKSREDTEKEAKKYDHYKWMDMGVLAAALGYDAINAEGHGESGSYTVVLNRTKVILSEERVAV